MCESRDSSHFRLPIRVRRNMSFLHCAPTNINDITTKPQLVVTVAFETSARACAPWCILPTHPWQAERSSETLSTSQGSAITSSATSWRSPFPEENDCKSDARKRNQFPFLKKIMLAQFRLPSRGLRWRKIKWWTGELSINAGLYHSISLQPYNTSIDTAFS